jgi:hypothetical protein
MKRILLTSIAAGCSLAAFGQGQVVFENFNNSNANITLNTSSPANAAPVTSGHGFAVALLWYNGSSFQIVATSQTSGGLAGTFNGGTVTLPGFQASGTFEVEGWYGATQNYASYAAAQAAGGSYLGITTSFTAAEAESPAPTPTMVIGGEGTPPPGAWNGDLVLVVPEPSTIALGGLGAAALLLFRRKK